MTTPIPRTHRIWSKDECDSLLAMIDSGMTDAACAPYFGVTKVAIGQKRRKLRGPKPPESPPWTQEECAELLRRWKAGEHAHSISAAMNRTVWAVRCKYYDIGSDQARLERLDQTNRVYRPVKPDPAEHAMAAARQLQHKTVTASIFGDPLPGRSALDKRASSLT